jgi:hypothetical protein
MVLHKAQFMDSRVSSQHSSCQVWNKRNFVLHVVLLRTDLESTTFQEKGHIITNIESFIATMSKFI